MKQEAVANPAKPASTSAWSPLGIPLFRMLWIAAVASHIGTAMHDIGAGYLMTTLSPTPIMVALVQTATSLPIFLLALSAGALSDIFDRRRYLLVAQIRLALVSACLGVLTITGITSAWTLVLRTFAMGLGLAMMLPAWAALTPERVPRKELPPAIALNSMGVNTAMMIAAAGMVLAIPLTWRWRISGIGDKDLTPSMHWPSLAGYSAIRNDRGPVLVTVEYQVLPEQHAEFLKLMQTVGKSRKRDGSYAWGIFESTDRPGTFIETFNVESWLEHRRQHLRVTDTDRALHLQVHALLQAGTQPLIGHYVSPHKHTGAGK